MKHKYITCLLCASMIVSSFSTSVFANDLTDVEMVTEVDGIIEENIQEDTFEDEPVQVEQPVEMQVGVENLIIDTNENIDTNEIEITNEDIEEPIEVSANMPSEADREAGEAVAAEIDALPEPTALNSSNIDEWEQKIMQAYTDMSNLSIDAMNTYLTFEQKIKITKLQARVEEIRDNQAAALEMTRKINHLPDIENITKANEAEIESLENEYNALSQEIKDDVDPAAVQKLIDARNKITQIDSIQEVDDYIDSEIEPLIQSGEYDAAHQQEIDDIIQAAKDAIAALAESGDPVNQSDIDAIIQAAKDAIAQVKTIHNLAAEEYEAKISAYKAPSDVTLADKDDIAQLRTDYNSLTDKAKQQVSTDIISGDETYYARLSALEKKISDLETALAQAKSEAKESLGKRDIIQSNYNVASGIPDKYYGVLGMILSEEFDDAHVNELEGILDEAYNKIDATRDASQISVFKEDALAKAKNVKDKERLIADDIERRIEAMGPVIDLSRSKADAVKSLMNEYNNLPRKAKQHVTMNKTSAGDTYYERLKALQDRIKKMAQDDARAQEAIINALPAVDNITVGDEGKITAARKAYESLTKEAKAEVNPAILQKLVDAENRLAIEKKKVEIANDLNSFAKDKKAHTSYFPDQLEAVNKALQNGLNNIKATKTVAEAKQAYNSAVNAINAVQTKAQRMIEQGTIKGFNQMLFRSKKVNKNTVWLRWKKMSGVDGYCLYGGKVGEEMKKLHQFDYNAASWKQTNLKKKTTYQYVLYAFKVVDGQIIYVYESTPVYVTTKGGKVGNVKSVKVSKIGKKSTKKYNKKEIKCTLKVGKTAKIKAKEVKSGKKTNKYRKLSYESTNPNIATVNKKGVITARSKGTCTIRAYSQNGAYRTIRLTVK